MTKCFNCGEDAMHRERLTNHSVRINKIDFVVPSAQVRRCKKCKEVAVSAPEIKRWRQLMQDDLADRGCTPNGGDVVKLRERMHISSNLFSALLGITRQTLHSWERDKAKAVPIGPASLLIDALGSEIGEDLISMLAKRGVSRGQISGSEASRFERNYISVVASQLGLLIGFGDRISTYSVAS